MAKKRVKRPAEVTEAKRNYLTVRISPRLSEKLDVYVEKMRKATPGGNWTRSSAALNLIATGLEAEHGG